MIKLEELSKSYGTVEAVRGVNLEIREGEILGFIGKNGAGKTTTIKMMMGLVHPTEGDVRFLGIGEGDIRQHVGYLPEELFLYDKLTGREFLTFVGRMHEMEDKQIDKRIEDLTDLFEISDKKELFIEGYSQGMRKKTALCASLIHEPKILLLDEPTNNLDVMSIRKLKEMLLRFKDEGKIIFFSSHVLAVAEGVCDRFGIIHEGRLLFDGTMEKLGERTGLREASLEEMFIKIIDLPESS